MTAAAIAARLDARRVGAGRWRARCPAHQDRLPSLSIREGDDGRVLLHCHAGCSTGDMLAAMGLRWRDLYSRSAPTQEQMAQARAEREAREQAARAVRRRERRRQEEIARTAGTIDRVLSHIGGQLMSMPDGAEADTLTAQYHSLCRELHGCELLLSR